MGKNDIEKKGDRATYMYEFFFTDEWMLYIFGTKQKEQQEEKEGKKKGLEQKKA